MQTLTHVADDAAHCDSFGDMPAERGTFGGLLVGSSAPSWAARRGRVHLYRWGDGGAHFHVWFLPRPLAARHGHPLPVWEDGAARPDRDRGDRREDRHGPGATFTGGGWDDAVTAQPELARRLGLGDAVVIGLGSMIGAGVFAAFAPAAAAAGAGC